jgi:hypothetical protein
MLEHLHKQQQQQQHQVPFAQQQQPQRQSSWSWEVKRGRDSFSQMLDLVTRQLSLFSLLISVWPKASRQRIPLSSSSSSELSVAELSALQLAPVVLDASGGRAAYLAIFLRHTDMLCRCLRREVEGLGDPTDSAHIGDADGSSSSICPELQCPPAVQQMLQSEQLLKLLAATQALYAQVLQRACLTGNNSSSSSSSSNGSSICTAASAATRSRSAATAGML